MFELNEKKPVVVRLADSYDFFSVLRWCELATLPSNAVSIQKKRKNEEKDSQDVFNVAERRVSFSLATSGGNILCSNTFRANRKKNVLNVVESKTFALTFIVFTERICSGDKNVNESIVRALTPE